jgi:hypothetical protein
MGWNLGSFAGELAIGALELAAGPPAAGTAARAASNQRDSETFLSVVIDCSSIYTGGVARLVAQTRSARQKNFRDLRFSAEKCAKNFLKKSIFPKMSVARLVTKMRSATPHFHNGRMG